MQKWEYQTIEVINGMVNQVNNQIINKIPAKGLSSSKLYTLDEYLSLIGQEGWEVIMGGTKSLLSSPERATDLNQVTTLIAKRPAG
ncbi:MAG: hypothetical protein IPN96_08580 [Anaerolineales bacterium]|nr:hypothetical protein [Anaerolineales bacterium]MBK8822809.1 hypothetical protein [Anaerolineales bacterium]